MGESLTIPAPNLDFSFGSGINADFSNVTPVILGNTPVTNLHGLEIVPGDDANVFARHPGHYSGGTPSRFVGQRSGR